MLYKTQRITNHDDLLSFRDRYNLVSGLDIPNDYLFSRDVYGVYERNNLVGGFILGKIAPYRTFTVFATEETALKLSSEFEDKDCVELTCVWADKSKMSALNGTIFWYQLGRKVNTVNADYVVFGTNKEGLKRNIYNNLYRCYIISTENINQINNYIYQCKKGHFLVAVVSALGPRIVYKLKRKFTVRRSAELV